MIRKGNLVLLARIRKSYPEVIHGYHKKIGKVIQRGKTNDKFQVDFSPHKNALDYSLNKTWWIWRTDLEHV